MLMQIFTRIAYPMEECGGRSTLSGIITKTVWYWQRDKQTIKKIVFGNWPTHIMRNHENEKGHSKLVEKEGLIGKWHWDNWLSM